MGNQQHDAAVDASPSSKRAFEYLETFAERSRRSDEQTTLIAGMPALLERGIMYFVGVAVLATLLILYFGRAQAIVETKGKILPQGNVIPLQAAQGGIVREVKASLGDSLPAGALVVRIDSSEANLTVAQLRNQRAADAEQLHVLRASLARLERVLASPEQPGRRRWNGVGRVDTPESERPRAGENPARRSDSGAGARPGAAAATRG